MLVRGARRATCGGTTRGGVVDREPGEWHDLPDRSDASPRVPDGAAQGRRRRRGAVAWTVDDRPLTPAAVRTWDRVATRAWSPPDRGPRRAGPDGGDRDHRPLTVCGQTVRGQPSAVNRPRSTRHPPLRGGRSRVWSSKFGVETRRLQHPQGHRRVCRRHDDRVVRLLHLRQPGDGHLAAVLPAGQRHAGADRLPLDLRGRLRRAAVRRAVLRPHRRPRRAASTRSW